MVKLCENLRSVLFISAVGCVFLAQAASAQWVACTSGSVTCTTQNAGVGVNNPASKFHVFTDSIADGITVDGTASPAISFRNAGTIFGYIGLPTQYHHYFWDAWPNDLIIRSEGHRILLGQYNSSSTATLIVSGPNVGIGTAFPAVNGIPSTLTIYDASERGMVELMTGQADADGVGAGQVGFFANANTAGKQVAAVYSLVSGSTATDRGGVLTFWTKPNGGALSERMRVDRDGIVSINGTTLGTNSSDKLIVNGGIRAVGVIGATYQDVAEWVPASEPIPPGTVVVVDGGARNGVTPSRYAYDTAVAGVISAQPGVLLGAEGPSKVKVATTGRVKVRVDASRIPVHAGDLLVSSDKPGVAMPSEAVDVAGIKMHRPGTLIGKALEPLRSGEGEILVLLSLQ